MSQIHDDENGETLRRLQESGDDLTAVRPIDFSVLFETQAAAERFAKVFPQQGDQVEIRQLEVDFASWSATVTREMAPRHDAISRIEQQIDIIAKPLGGLSDGWGCLVVS